MEKARPNRTAQPTSIRLSPTAMRLWERLAEHYGHSKKDVLETAIRQLARQEGISPEDDKA